EAAKWLTAIMLGCGRASPVYPPWCGRAGVGPCGANLARWGAHLREHTVRLSGLQHEQGQQPARRAQERRCRREWLARQPRADRGSIARLAPARGIPT